MKKRIVQDDTSFVPQHKFLWKWMCFDKTVYTMSGSFPGYYRFNTKEVVMVIMM